MALVTIQRSPSPSNDPDADVPDGTEEGASGRSPLRSRRTSKSRLQKLRKFFHTVRFITKLRPCLSESYFTVKGTALILPQSECARKTSKKSHGGDIQQHLQSMLYLLRHEDRIKVAVKLEQTGQRHQRYLALVWTVGRQDTEESVILGIDYTDRASVGLVLPIWAGTKIKLNGDGGFSVSADDGIYLFKPVSVQAMWSALQCLQKAVSLAEDQKYIPGGLTHTWVEYYNAKTDRSDCSRYSQWRVMEGIEIFGPNAVTDTADDNQQAMQSKISAKLREVMMSVDLDEATSKSLRTAVEERLNISLSDFKSYFDSEMMRILGQMDSPSMILDFLFLGSEWNASNLEELRNNGIGYILNVTREIDNFYTGILSYMNVRVYDEPESELLKHWEKTYKYINKAKKHGSKVLVHCKMGISRSASTVIAYLMKENRWSLEKALEFVQEKRNVINPNSGFREQLTTYEGMLKASDHRHVFHSSEPNLGNVEEEEVPPAEEDIFLGGGLFHTSPDNDLASEEEILRSLKLEKGQGDTDDMMMEADLETGSRSTDSLEESLPDIPSPTPDQDLKKKTGQYDFHSDLASGIVSGAVAGSDPAVLEESSDASSDDELMDCGDDGTEAEAVGCQIPTIVEPARDLTFIDTATGPSRIKPDNSWIKLDIDTSESTDDPSSVDEQELAPPVFRISDDGDTPEVDMPHPETYFCPVTVELFKPTVSSVHKIELVSVSQTVESSHDTLGASHMDTGSDVTAQTVGGVGVTQDDVQHLCASETPDSNSALSDRQVELGVKQYYAQEQIPWFPGTVQKIKQEICKSAVDYPPCECSSAKTDEASELKLESDIDVLYENCAITQQLTIQTADLHTSQSCGQFETLDTTERPAKRRRPVSVYEKEEIPLEQGLVKKTTLEIEEKNRLFGGDSEDVLFYDLKPVQRSASLKERSSSKSRQSERRKTCGPILSPSILKDQPSFVTSDTSDDTQRQELTAAESVENRTIEQSDTDKSSDTDVIVDNRTVCRSDSVQCKRENSEREERDKEEEFIVKYGDEEVPLVKGKVKKQTQDFESMTDSDIERGGVCINTVTLDEVKDSSHTVHSDSSMTAGDFSSHNIPKPVSCDKQQTGASKITDIWMGVIEEKVKSEQSSMTSCVPKPSKSTDENSPFNDETLALIREIGSVLVNTPVKPVSVEAEAVGQECSNVKTVVRQIEMQQKKVVKNPHHREIIIIEDTSKKSSSGPRSPVSHDSSSSKPPSIVQTAGSVFGLQGFHTQETQSKHRPVESIRSDGLVHRVDHHLTGFRSLDTCSGNRDNLSLNLFGEFVSKVETDSKGLHEEMIVEGEVSQTSHVRSPGTSPRSDTDHSVVKHLVGRFEKDVKSPISEKVEFISGAKRSHSVSESPTSKEAASDVVAGSNFPESFSFQMRKDFSIKSESGAMSSEKTLPRLTRPKSADHAETRSSKTSVEQLKVKRQGNTNPRQLKTTDSHHFEPHQYEQQAEPNSDDCRKVRCLQGKSHPLTKLNVRLGSKPFYNTM